MLHVLMILAEDKGAIVILKLDSAISICIDFKNDPRQSSNRVGSELTPKQRSNPLREPHKQ